MTLEEFDRKTIREALIRHRGNVLAIAREIDMAPTSLKRYIRRLGIRATDFKHLDES